jgi:hypothetical protein
MAVNVITTEDLHVFKQELLTELKEFVSTLTPPKWLKSPQVRKMLGISPGTLQNLRINGTLPYTKVGGVIYYAYEDLIRVMEENKRNKLW